MNIQTPPISYVGILIALTLAGCTSPGAWRSAPGASSETLLGNYEAIAGCVAEAGTRSARGGGPTLKLEKNKKLATLSRTVAPSATPQYEITFSQYGATTVQAEGRVLGADSDSNQAFQFLWSQAAMCATNLMAP